MHKPNPISRWMMSLWLALSLLAPPLAPAFAAVPVADAHIGADAVAMHAGHDMARHDAGSTGHQDAGCAQHEQCSGKCCAACAQCFTATLTVSIPAVGCRTVQSPIVLRLHDRLVAAAHSRPPSV